MNKIIEKVENLLEFGGTKKDIVLLVISGVFLLFSIFEVPMPFHSAWVAVILCGLPIILEAIIGLITAFDIKADVLVSLALIASVCIGEDFAAGEVAFIMQLGALLEDLTVAKARAGIEKLVHLTPQTARVISNGKEKIIPAENVKIGDVIRVLPGESIPVDGVIISGQTSVNQAVMTGESLPVDKAVDDDVKELPHLISLSKRMMTTIKCNLAFSMGLNFLAIALAITGVLNPVVGALVHNAGSILVIINSVILLNWKRV